MSHPEYPKPHKARTAILLTVTAVATVLVVAWLIGNATMPPADSSPKVSSSADQTIPPRPTVTVTKTLPAPPPVTATVHNTSSPQSCLNALDDADKGFGYASEATSALSELDFEGASAATAKLKALAPRYQLHKAQCRAMGGN